MEKATITVEATIQLAVEKIWTFWTSPEHIIKWNNASDDWHTTFAENDLRAGGKFLYRMEAKDESFGFDFWGIYNTVKTNELIDYTMGDGRNASVLFTAAGNATKITETFEPETENTVELQKSGWQSILNNFRNYAEATAQN